jgi:hypothetical protein
LALRADARQKFYGRSHDAVIRVYDETGNVIEDARARGRVQRMVSIAPETKSRHAAKRDG